MSASATRRASARFFRRYRKVLQEAKQRDTLRPPTQNPTDTLFHNRLLRSLRARAKRKLALKAARAAERQPKARKAAQ